MKVLSVCVMGRSSCVGMMNGVKVQGAISDFCAELCTPRHSVVVIFIRGRQ